VLLLIDNYDSFSHNLARYFVELGQTVNVVRNDQISIQEIERLQPDYLVLSPGPCTPNEAGISLDAVKAFAGRIPMLGVCLGHQTIAQAFGAKIVGADSVMHGKTSQLQHNRSKLFNQVNQSFRVTRYHSLVVEPGSLSQDFDVTAWVDSSEKCKREIMAIEHKSFTLMGVQFHPESLMTEFGHQILANFLHY
jgi:anthranilate synthase/aminodeoxychorismate synthase-like glutamine amidotransferase